ncbi:MAG: heavy metal-associated domain-containing protein [Sphaerochaetaceae bacterium]
MKTTLTTKGMMCSGCQKRLLNSLAQVKGISDVEASYETGKVSFTYIDEHTLNLAKEAIEDTGFEVV